MAELLIAIDPGIAGGIAHKITNCTVMAGKCPETQREIVQSIKDLVDAAKYKNIDTIKCIIESVHAFPGEGVKSVWTFSGNFHTWTTSLIALDIPFKTIRPQEWQKQMGLPPEKRERKLALKVYAQNMYPHLKVTYATADALAILSKFNILWS